MARSITIAPFPVCRGPYTSDNLQATGRFLGNLARRTDPTSASAPILAEPCLRHLQRRGSPVRLAGHSHRRIAAVVLDPDMTMRFGAVRLLAFELLLPPPRFSTRRVSASELVAFVDLVWGPGIFISNHLGGSPFGSRGCVTSDGELLPIRCSLFGCRHLQTVFNHPPQCSLSRMAS